MQFLFLGTSSSNKKNLSVFKVDIENIFLNVRNDLLLWKFPYSCFYGRGS